MYWFNEIGKNMVSLDVNVLSFVSTILFFVKLKEKEQKQFKESLKQEFKLLKQEIDMLPKDIRKDTFKRKREEKEIEQTEKVILLWKVSNVLQLVNW